MDVMLGSEVVTMWPLGDTFEDRQILTAQYEDNRKGLDSVSG